MMQSPLDSFERGRRAGIIQTLGAMTDFTRGGGDWQQIGQLFDLARETESQPTEFDLNGLLSYLARQDEQALIQPEEAVWG